jgi:hypothetical protein
MPYIGIVGARKFKDKEAVKMLVKSLPEDPIIVTSGCAGVCVWTQEQARASGLQVLVYAPDLTSIRSNFDIPKRYYQRNRELIERCDFLHAFLSKEGGYTGGTRFEIEYAVKRGVPVRVHYEQGESQLIWQQALPFNQEHFTAAWQDFFVQAVA